VVDKDQSQKQEKPVRPTAPVAKKIESPKKAAPAANSDKPKKANRIVRWYRETVGELRKVNWPTPKDAWKLTKIVLIVMLAMSVGLGLLDFLFEQGVLLLVQ
jgi:preprotein translocase subunit SecE